MGGHVGLLKSRQKWDLVSVTGVEAEPSLGVCWVGTPRQVHQSALPGAVVTHVSMPTLQNKYTPCVFVVVLVQQGVYLTGD